MSLVVIHDLKAPIQTIADQINEAISRVSSYGWSMITVPKGRRCVMLMWSNHGRCWAPFTPHWRVGEIVSLDANRILVQGISSLNFAELQPLLLDHPLYPNSTEDKERGTR